MTIIVRVEEVSLPNASCYMIGRNAKLSVIVKYQLIITYTYQSVVIYFKVQSNFASTQLKTSGYDFLKKYYIHFQIIII